MSSYRHAIMPPFHHVIGSSYHHPIMSSCHHRIMSPYHQTTKPSYHHTTIPPYHHTEPNRTEPIDRPRQTHRPSINADRHRDRQTDRRTVKQTERDSRERLPPACHTIDWSTNLAASHTSVCSSVGSRTRHKPTENIRPTFGGTLRNLNKKSCSLASATLRNPTSIQ